MTSLFARTLLVALVVTTTSSDAAAEGLLCGTIQPGDTASAVARRFTGREESRHQPWFLIVDRVRSKVIPKAGYDRILSGWQVCVPAARLSADVSSSSRTDTIARNDPALPVGGPRSIAARRPPTGPPASRNWTLELVFLVVGPPVFGAAIGCGWHSVERFLTNRRALKREIQAFATMFVKDFERPLVIDDVAARPIRARLRWVPSDRRLDILLAPAGGRRYPNLEDHRRNVEYDVNRITHRLSHRSFVRRPLRAEGRWVVIPFEFKPGPKTGALV